MKFGPTARIRRLGNSAKVEVDFFFDSLRTFKTEVDSPLPLTTRELHHQNVQEPFILFVSLVQLVRDPYVV